MPTITILFQVYASLNTPGQVGFEFIQPHLFPSLGGAMPIGRVMSDENGDVLSFDPAKGLPAEVIDSVERKMANLERLPGRPKPKVISYAEMKKATK